MINKQKEETKDHEASQIPEAYENVKYFEKQRNKNSANDSVNGEKLSFKGRLGSVKCDDSVINSHIDAPSVRNKDIDIQDCKRSITDNKSFSFKNISNRNKNKNEEDTINDMLNSQNSSRRSLLRDSEYHNNDADVAKLGFSNLHMSIDNKEREATNKHENDKKSLLSFGENLLNKPKNKSPSKAMYYSNHESGNNSRFVRPVYDEGPICSMMGVIDEHSNNIDHKFMFGNESKTNKMEENNSISNMFRNQYSNSFLMAHGTPKKFEASQNNVFDPNNEHSNISAIFPGLESNTLPKKLFQKDLQNEPMQFGGNIAPKRKQSTPIKEAENGNNRISHALTPELLPQQYLSQEMEVPDIQIDEPERKINEDIPLVFGQNSKEECSLPHPMDLFRLQDKGMAQNSSKASNKHETNELKGKGKKSKKQEKLSKSKRLR